MASARRSLAPEAVTGAHSMGGCGGLDVPFAVDLQHEQPCGGMAGEN